LGIVLVLVVVLVLVLDFFGRGKRADYRSKIENENEDDDEDDWRGAYTALYTYETLGFYVPLFWTAVRFCHEGMLLF
jgi:hypothetical protein